MLTLFALSAMSVLLQKAFSLHSGFISSLKIAFFFFLCESGNTCGFLSKTCACGNTVLFMLMVLLYYRRVQY